MSCSEVTDVMESGYFFSPYWLYVAGLCDTKYFKSWNVLVLGSKLGKANWVYRIEKNLLMQKKMDM